jgi:hypothetical protein
MSEFKQVKNASWEVFSKLDAQSASNRISHLLKQFEDSTIVNFSPSQSAESEIASLESTYPLLLATHYLNVLICSECTESLRYFLSSHFFTLASQNVFPDENRRSMFELLWNYGCISHANLLASVSLPEHVPFLLQQIQSRGSHLACLTSRILFQNSDLVQSIAIWLSSCEADEFLIQQLCECIRPQTPYPDIVWKTLLQGGRFANVSSICLSHLSSSHFPEVLTLYHSREGDQRACLEYFARVLPELSEDCGRCILQDGECFTPHHDALLLQMVQHEPFARELCHRLQRDMYEPSRVHILGALSTVETFSLSPSDFSFILMLCSDCDQVDGRHVPAWRALRQVITYKYMFFSQQAGLFGKVMDCLLEGFRGNQKEEALNVLVLMLQLHKRHTFGSLVPPHVYRCELGFPPRFTQESQYSFYMSHWMELLLPHVEWKQALLGIQLFVETSQDDVVGFVHWMFSKQVQLLQSKLSTSRKRSANSSVSQIHLLTQEISVLHSCFSRLMQSSLNGAELDCPKLLSTLLLVWKHLPDSPTRDFVDFFIDVLRGCSTWTETLREQVRSRVFLEVQLQHESGFRLCFCQAGNPILSSMVEEMWVGTNHSDMVMWKALADLDLRWIRKAVFERPFMLKQWEGLDAVVEQCAKHAVEDETIWYLVCNYIVPACQFPFHPLQTGIGLRACKLLAKLDSHFIGLQPNILWLTPLFDLVGQMLDHDCTNPLSHFVRTFVDKIHTKLLNTTAY